MRVDDQTYAACVASIRARVEILDSWRGMNPPAADRASMWGMSTIIDRLARRVLQPLDWPGHDVTEEAANLWLLQWYLDYCQAALELCRLAQHAVKEGVLTLRSTKSRAPLDSATEWAALDLPQAVKDSKLFPECKTWNPITGSWPDALCMPPGAATLGDVETWVAGVGVSDSGELHRLLGIAEPKLDEPLTLTALQAEEVEPQKDIDLAERVPLMETNLRRVRTALAAAGYNPDALPQPPRGKKCPVKAAAKAGAGLSEGAFEHAWKALRKQARPSTS